MRPRFQISAAGSLIVILIAALGFAAVSAGSSAAEPDPATSAELPSSLTARVAAAGFASGFEPTETAVDEPEAVTIEVAASPTPQAAPEPTTTTTSTTTTTTTPPTTTTTAPPATTTTTTTTAPPPTTTTTSPPATTTTTPPTTTTTEPPVGAGSRDVEEWRSLVSQFFAAELVDEALSVMRCESLGDPAAYNPRSGASGLFQFIPSTWDWASQNAGYAGVSPFNPEANVASAAWLVQTSIDQGKSAWVHWTCKP